ncbi:hypothetical protein [Streptosporangium vulgare]|uniref:Core-binding (CB) domain-containing protein n=1 Tax=Streptosporangium vulgare TaxID=46190 RepID=A0ABV5TQ99_9ACTN
MSGFEKQEAGFQFIDAGAVLTPAETDLFLKLLNNELGSSQLAARKARRAELDAFKTYLKARKHHELDPDCPEAGRGAGQVTEKARELWFEARIPTEYWAWKDAVLARQEAVDYAWQVKAQIKLMQSINSNAKVGYETYRGGGR